EVFGDAAAFASSPGAFAAALADALDRPDAARRAAGRALAARYTWAEAARRHLELYRSRADGPSATDVISSHSARPSR
ncbi:MAG TPA: hypothetical protein VFY38_00575, partial [Pseudonocardia sp.]|nr:hypothetical protein [Pseudonocardia sp.]